MESKYQIIYKFLNPIKHLLDDSSITEIMINKPNDVWVKRFGCKTEKDKSKVSSDQIR